MRNLTKEDLIGFLKRHSACAEATLWVAEQPGSFAEMWYSCPHGAWLIWLCDEAHKGQGPADAAYKALERHRRKVGKCGGSMSYPIEDATRWEGDLVRRRLDYAGVFLGIVRRIADYERFQRNLREQQIRGF